MNAKTVSLTSRLAAAAALILGCVTASAQELVDPVEDQGVYLGETATFTAEPKFGNLSFQWIRQWPEHDELLKGETANSLTISNAALKDVGLYACIVSMGETTQLTRSAVLNVAVSSALPSSTEKKGLSQSARGGGVMALDYGGSSVTVFGPPVANGGSQGTCPGTYAGYVNYMKTTAQGWGWSPDNSTTTHTATDLNRSDTKVEYGGKYFDQGCAQTTVTVPHPTYSPKYRFTIYFPTNVPATNAYAITLDGFNP